MTHRPLPIIDDEHIAPPATMDDLSAKQLAVAALLSRGKSDKQIMASLGITQQRVSQHVEAIAYLLHCDPAGNIRLQIALWWRDQAPAHVTHAA